MGNAQASPRAPFHGSWSVAGTLDSGHSLGDRKAAAPRQKSHVVFEKPSGKEGWPTRPPLLHLAVFSRAARSSAT